MPGPPPLPYWIDLLQPVAGSAAWAVDRLPVWSVSIELAPWTGPEALETDRNKSTHCGKGRALVEGRNHGYSCGEVEIVRRVLDVEGWAAGWVQPYICGRLSWSDWIMPLAPENERLRQHHRLNAAQVARFRGTKERAVLGHPDVIAWRGEETIFVEYKSAFDGGVSDDQVAWFTAARRIRLATSANYVIVNQE